MTSYFGDPAHGQQKMLFIVLYQNMPLGARDFCFYPNDNDMLRKLDLFRRICLGALAMVIIKKPYNIISLQHWLLFSIWMTLQLFRRYTTRGSRLESFITYLQRNLVKFITIQNDVLQKMVNMVSIDTYLISP